MRVGCQLILLGIGALAGLELFVDWIVAVGGVDVASKSEMVSTMILFGSDNRSWGGGCEMGVLTPLGRGRSVDMCMFHRCLQASFLFRLLECIHMRWSLRVRCCMWSAWVLGVDLDFY